MQITNEISNPKPVLPEDLRAAVEKARNDVTLMQAETKRLLNLRNSLEKDVYAKHEEISKLEDRIRNLETEKSSAESRRDKAEEEAVKAERELEQLTKSCRVLIDETRELQEKLQKVDAILKI